MSARARRCPAAPSRFTLLPLPSPNVSDDSTRYRDTEEMAFWADVDHPVKRLRRYMEAKGWWSEEQEEATLKEERKLMLEALARAEKKPKPPLENLFADVYYEPPESLLRQEKELHEHLAKYDGLERYENTGTGGTHA